MDDPKNTINLDLTDIKQSGLFDWKQLATIINKNTILEGKNIVKTITIVKKSDSEFEEIHNIKGIINLTWRNTMKNSDVETILKKMSDMEKRITLNIKKEVKNSETRVKKYVNKKVKESETRVKAYVDTKFDEHVKKYH